MPRRSRVQCENAFYHVMNRGCGRMHLKDISGQATEMQVIGHHTKRSDLNRESVSYTHLTLPTILLV